MARESRRGLARVPLELAPHADPDVADGERARGLPGAVPARTHDELRAPAPDATDRLFRPGGVVGPPAEVHPRADRGGGLVPGRARAAQERLPAAVRADRDDLGRLGALAHHPAEVRDPAPLRGEGGAARRSASAALGRSSARARLVAGLDRLPRNDARRARARRILAREALHPADHARVGRDPRVGAAARRRDRALRRRGLPLVRVAQRTIRESRAALHGHRHRGALGEPALVRPREGLPLLYLQPRARVLRVRVGLRAQALLGSHRAASTASADAPAPGALLRRFLVLIGSFYLGFRYWGVHFFPEQEKIEIAGITGSRWIYYWGISQSMIHFYYDGFLWKMRSPETRANI